MIITCANQKGGVGKTTANVFLAQFFAFIKNMPVLIIDTDEQCNATRALLGSTEGRLSLMDIVMNGVHPKDVIVPTNIKNLDIIKGHDVSLQILGHFLGSEARGSYMLRDVIQDYRLLDKYQVIFVDTPPNLGPFTIASLVAADFVIIPLENTVYAAEGYVKFIRTLQAVKREMNPDIELLGAFINKFEARSSISKEIIHSYTVGIGDILFKTVVRKNVSIEESVAKHCNLYTYAPKSNGAQDFASLGDEIIARMIQKGKLIMEIVQ